MKSKLSYSLRACVLLFSLLTINTLFAQNAIQKKTISVALVNQQDQMQTNANSQIIKIQEEVALSNVNDLLQTTYELSSTDNLVQTSSKLDAIGYSHYKYQQEYKGLIVEWSTVTVHSKQGIIKNISGNYRKISELNIDPDLSSAQGLQMALNQVNAEKYIWDENPEINPPNGDLVVFTHPHSGTNHLAYKYDVYSFEPLYRAFVYVDANNGEVLFENNRIHHSEVAASGTSLYNNNVSFTADIVGPNDYRMRQSITETYSANNLANYSNLTDITSTSATSWADATAVQAHWGAEQTHSYFLQKHNRNSFDDAGGVILSYIHFDLNYNNAFWDGVRMTYGDGDGVDFGPLVSLDVVGHEITHGVTEYSANLVYERESGALNESFSDIFGEATENHGSGVNNWQIGTEIGAGGSDGAIRSMDNPNLFNDPDTYSGDNWRNPECGTPTRFNDYCGVHTNSGVQNKWFFLLTDGEIGTNDNTDDYDVTGIGLVKAAEIAYRNLTVYLNTSSKYDDARTGALQSADDLFGLNSPEYISTMDAWYAVGVGLPYLGGKLTYANISCGGASDGWISLEVHGVDPTYLWNDGVTTKDRTNLPPGYYSVTITDAFGQTINAAVTLTGPPELFASALVDNNVSCYNGADGQATASASGGLMPYTYLWSDGQATATATGLSAGIYSVAVTDANLCTASSGVTISEPPPLTASIATPPAIPGGLPGTIYLGWGPQTVDLESTAGGGTPDYTYLWDDGQTTAIALDMSAGVHMVTITDANGCSEEANIEIALIDVRCGKKNNKVLLCHVPPDDPSNEHTICISTNAVANHIADGDFLSSCNDKSASIKEFELMVYPVPSSGSVSLEFNLLEDAEMSLQVFSLNGQVLYQDILHESEGSYIHSINLSHLSDGFYMLQVKNQDVVETRKIQIQH